MRQFERSRRGAQLIPVGAAILPAVRQFAEQPERPEFAVHEAVVGRSGVLTIGALSSVMLDVLPSLLERLKSEYPYLTILVKEIASAEASPELEAGDIDLACARLECTPGGTIQSLSLAHDRPVVAMPRDHAMRGISRIRLAALEEEGFVMFSRQVRPMYFDSLVASCRSNGYLPEYCMRSVPWLRRLLSWPAARALRWCRHR